MSREAAQAILTAFSTQASVAELRLDEAGWCRLGLDDLVVHVEVPERGELMAFNAWLGEAPEARRTEVALVIADADYLLLGARGATLGMVGRSGDVTIARQLEVEHLTLERFERALEFFADAALSWRGRLFPDAPPEPQRPPQDFMMRA